MILCNRAAQSSAKAPFEITNVLDRYMKLMFRIFGRGTSNLTALDGGLRQNAHGGVSRHQCCTTVSSRISRCLSAPHLPIPLDIYQYSGSLSVPSSRLSQATQMPPNPAAAAQMVWQRPRQRPHTATWGNRRRL